MYCVFELGYQYFIVCERGKGFWLYTVENVGDFRGKVEKWSLLVVRIRILNFFQF